MKQCRATKRDGSPCSLAAQGPDGLCWAHSPKNEAARRKGQSKGGRSKSITDLVKLRDKLTRLGDDVLAGRVNRSNAAVAVTAYGAATKCVEAVVRVRELEEARLVETGLKVREQEQLVERLDELERLLEAREVTA